jgi:hypothetical protein
MFCGSRVGEKLTVGSKDTEGNAEGPWDTVGSAVGAAEENPNSFGEMLEEGEGVGEKLTVGSKDTEGNAEGPWDTVVSAVGAAEGNPDGFGEMLGEGEGATEGSLLALGLALGLPVVGRGLTDANGEYDGVLVVDGSRVGCFVTKVGDNGASVTRLDSPSFVSGDPLLLLLVLSPTVLFIVICSAMISEIFASFICAPTGSVTCISSFWRNLLCCL